MRREYFDRMPLRKKASKIEVTGVLELTGEYDKGISVIYKGVITGYTKYSICRKKGINRVFMGFKLSTAYKNVSRRLRTLLLDLDHGND